MAEKIKKDDLRAALKFLVGLLVAIVIYNICVYCFLFYPTFHRDDSIRSVESEIKFYAGEDNYNRHIADEEWFYALNCPMIEITSRDGLKLTAFRYDAENSAQANGTFLLMHGFHSGPVREFATLAKVYHDMGYNVIMPYQRAHGDSEGTWVTFGIRERYDCRDWMTKINEIYGEELPLFVSGISMGCATVTMAAGCEDLPVNVRGFVSDCGFTTPGEIVHWTIINNYHLPNFMANLLTWSGDCMAGWFADFHFDDYSTYESLKVCQKPILFITGTADETVPCQMTEKNYNNYAAKRVLYDGDETDKIITQLVTFEGTPHAISYLTDSEKYNSAVKAFVEKYGAK